MEKVVFKCKYCNTQIECAGKDSGLLKEFWDSTHESCKDFLYVYKINVREKEGVEKYGTK
jgi:hypothetical protein